MSQLITHAAIVGLLTVCYTVITVTGSDGTPLLGVIGGYIGGAGATAAVAKANGGKV